MKHLILVALASGLAGCASLSSNPEYSQTYGSGLPTLTAPDANATPKTLLTREFASAVGVGNVYRSVALKLGDEDLGASALTLGSGFYGAAVTAFNPAPKNLLASILSAGTAQAWRTSLKPAERARIYVQGYRSMGCLVDRGGVLLTAQDDSEIAALRNVTSEILQVAERARRVALSTPPAKSATPAELALTATRLEQLGAFIDQIREVDAALRLEQASYLDAPYRVGRVRRQIEDNVEKRLAGVAPDYAGALAILKESAKLPTQTEGAGGAEEGVVETKSTRLRETYATLALPPNAALADLLRTLPDDIAALKRATPTKAADAYQRIGECVVTTS